MRILETCAAIEGDGFEVVILPVQSDGIVDLDSVRGAVNPQTLIVSVMLANNEIGVLQPIRDIAEICRQAGAYMHTDATSGSGENSG